MLIPASIRRLSLILAMAFTAASCATEPPPQFPELRYTHLPQIGLDVAEIRIVDNTAGGTDANRVENRMPVAPKVALTNWAKDRLRADGVSGVAVFTIEEASVVEAKLKQSGGLKGVFTKEQAERYDAKVAATLKLEGVPRVTQAFAQAQVTHSQTVREDATLNDRDQAWFDLTETVMKDFDPAMSNSIRQHLGQFVRE